MAQTNYSFTSSTLDGTVTSRVYSGDTSNPYGGLTFTYFLTLYGSSADSASELTVGSYGGFATDVSYNISGGGVAPSNFTRSLSGNGSVVRFVWGGGGLMPGQTGDVVVVQTGASNYGFGQGGVIDSQTANVVLLAPVPEPTVGALAAAGLGALIVFRRKRNSN